MANININKKVHFLYKSTNRLNQNYYVGVHSTNRVDDSYIGSGKRFRSEVRKYGKSNFIREILQFFDTREEALVAEYLTVSQIIQDPKCLNLCEGGKVGGLNKDARKLSKERRDWLRANDPSWNKKVSDAVSSGLKESYKGRFGTFTGKTHKPETIELMKLAKKGKNVGSTNSQFGTFWITNGRENKKTKSEIPQGWYKGRVFTKN